MKRPELGWLARGGHADDVQAVRALDGAARNAKAAACLAYASQLGFPFGGTAGLAAKLAEAGAVEAFRGAFELMPTAVDDDPFPLHPSS